jgi:uncharacterized membrane protein
MVSAVLLVLTYVTVVIVIVVGVALGYHAWFCGFGDWLSLRV